MNDRRTIALTKQEQLAIDRLFGQMPYSGLCNFHRYNSSDGLRVEYIVHNLTQPRDELLKVAQENDQVEKELDRYRHIMEAGRQLFKFFSSTKNDEELSDDGRESANTFGR